MPPISEWDAVVREIQHETGLPDDAFSIGPRDELVIEGGGYRGDVTSRERSGIIGVAESRDLAVFLRDGGAVVEVHGPGASSRVERDPDGDFRVGGYRG